MALSSGMAAISNTVLTLAKSGSNIIVANSIFGNTVSLFKETFKDWGLQTRFVDILCLDEVEQNIDANSSFIFF